MSRLLQKNAKAPPLSSAADEGVRSINEIYTLHPKEVDLAYLKGIQHTNENDSDIFINWWLHSESELFILHTYVKKVTSQLSIRNGDL